MLERRITRLEGGVAAVAASSGHSAQFLAIATVAKAGDNIIATSFLYGGTSNQFRNFFPHLGITVKIVNGDNPDDFAKLIDENTKALYIESMGNPRYNVPDFESFAKVAHDNGIPLIVSAPSHINTDLPLTQLIRSTTHLDAEVISFAPLNMEQISSLTLARSGLAATE